MRLNAGPDLAGLKAVALRRVEAAAERARVLVGGGPGEILELLAAEADARAALARGRPPAEGEHPFVDSEVTAHSRAGRALTRAAAAAALVAEADARMRRLAAIRTLRRAARLRIIDATTPAEVRAAEDAGWPG